MRDIGKNIKDLRQARNMTQEELAEKLFVTRQTVSNYETGKSRPDIDMLLKIAEVLDTDIHSVLYGPPAPMEKRRKIITACVSLGVYLLAVVLYYRFAQFADVFKSTHYDTRFVWLLGFLIKPVILFWGAWVFMQVLGTFTKLAPMRKPEYRWVRLGAYSIMVLYGILISPYLPIMFFSGGSSISIPDFWTKAIFFVVGALPDQIPIITNTTLAIACGLSLWLFRTPKKKETAYRRSQ